MSTYLSLNVHIVFATEDRAPWILANVREEFFAYTGGIIRKLGAEPMIINGAADHVHALVKLRATHCVADLVRETKKATNAWMSQHQPGFAWQGGYGALTVGQAEVPRVYAYIANQEEHHRKVSSEDEYRKLLTEAGVEIDERFFR